MGSGECRFPECQKLPYSDRPRTNRDYHISLLDQGLKLTVCGLWEHYALEHNVLPPDQARQAVIATGVKQVTGKTQTWGGLEKKTRIEEFIYLFCRKARRWI